MKGLNRLREWRAENDYSLREAAGLAGVSLSFLSRLERDLRGVSPRTKVLIARRLGANVEDLFPPEAEEVPDDAA